MVTSFVGTLLLTNSFVAPKGGDSSRPIISAASVEDWESVYTYTKDATTSTVTITGLNEDYATVDGLVIPSHILGDPVTKIGEMAFENNSYIKYVFFEDNSNVTTFADRSFHSIPTLKHIEFPSSLTTTGYWAFGGSGLLSVHIPSTLTTIGSRTFDSMKSLTAFTVDANHPNYATKDGLLFNKNFTSLISVPAGLSGEVVIPDTVTHIDNSAICGSSTITNVVIPDSVITIDGENFMGMTALTEIILPNSVTGPVESYFANGCINLQYVKLSENNNYINGHAFKNCYALTSIVIPEGVTKVNNEAFNNCTSLSSVVLPSTITSIGVNTFANTAITTMQTPNDTFVKDATSFANCEVTWFSSEELYYYTTDSTYANIKGLSIAASDAGVSAVRVPATLGGKPVKTIGYGGWSNDIKDNLRPYANVRAIGFEPNNSLTSISTHGFHQAVLNELTILPSVTTAQILADPVKYVYVDEANTTFITNEDNTLLLSADGTILHGVGFGYKNTTLTIPESVTTLPYRAIMFSSNKHNIDKIEGLEHVTNYPGAGINDGFALGNKFTTFTYPAVVDDVKTQVWQAANLTTLIYQEGIKTITYGANNCNKLTTLILPSTLTLIKSGAFSNNVKALASVVIPSGCTVEEGAFASTTTLIYEDDVVAAQPFTYTVNDDGTTVTITGLKEEYQTLDSITIPVQIDGKDVTIIGELPYPTLTSIKFAEGSKVLRFLPSNGNRALIQTNITSITLPASYVGDQWGNRTICGHLATQCMQNIYVDEANPYFTSVDGVLFSKNLTKLMAYPSGRTGEYIVPDYVTWFGNASFQWSKLTRITLPEGIICIENATFSDCPNLEEVVYPDSLPIRTDIGTGYKYSRSSKLFANGLCVIPDGTPIIGTSEYSGCTFEAVVIPASVTEINAYGLSSRNLKYVIFQGGPVTIKANAFHSCVSLPKVVVIPTGSIVEEGAFPSGVTWVEADSLWDTTANGDGVTVTPKTDLNTNINTLIVPKTIGGLNVYSLAGLTANNARIGALVFSHDSVCTTLAEGSLRYSNLKYLYLADSIVSESVTSCRSAADGGTYQVSELYIPNDLIFELNTIENLGRIRLVDMPNISKFILNYDNPNYKLIDGNLYTIDGTTLVATIKTDTGSFVLPEGVTTIGAHAFYQSRYSSIDLFNGDLTTINEAAFAYTSNLSGISIPANVALGKYLFGRSTVKYVEIDDSINLKDASSIFYGVTGMEAFQFSQSTTISPYTMFYTGNIKFVLMNEGLLQLRSQTFHAITNLMHLHLPSTLTTIDDSALTINGVAGDTTNLMITIEEGNTSFVMYEGCLYSADMKHLYKATKDVPAELIIPNGVTHIHHTFADRNKNIISIVMPDTVTTLSNYSIYNMPNLENLVVSPNITTTGATGVFASLPLITELEIPGGITSLTKDFMYKNDSLVKVTLNEGLQTINSHAFRDLPELTTINIPSSVTSIASDAFYNCPKLSLTAIPEAMTEIADYAFDGNTGLTEIFIPNTVTYVGVGAFRNCTNLTRVVFEEGSPLTTLGSSLFEGCTKLAEVVLPQNLASISPAMFKNCASLKTLELPNTLKSIGMSSFQSTSALTTLTLPNGLQTISDSAFYSTGLTAVTIPSTLTTLGTNVFKDATKLQTVTFDNNTLTTIPGYTFRNCRALTSVTLPSSITNIAEYAFDFTPKLTTINFPTIDYTIGDYAFYKTGLTSVTLHEGVTIGVCAFDSSNLASVTWNSNQTYIPDGAFSNCTKLTEFTVPAHVTEIGVCAFDYCTSLSKVEILGTLDSIGDGAFEGCTKLTTINLDNVLSIGEETFMGCKSLNSIGTFSTNLTRIGCGAFRDCSSLVIDVDFRGVTNLTIEEKAFYYAGITSINFPTNVIPKYVCYGCPNLRTAVIPSSVTEIGKNAFYNCPNLTGITLPEGLQTIGDYAFQKSPHIVDGDTLVIPSTVTVIGQYAFHGIRVNTIDMSGASSLTTIGFRAFDSGLSSTNAYADLVNTVLFPRENSKLQYLGEFLFYYQRIYEIDLTLNSATPDINRAVFQGATKITKANIRNIDTNAQNVAIGPYFFQYNRSLEEVYLDASFGAIGNYAFQNCTSLKSIYLDGAIGVQGRTGVVTLTSTSFNGVADNIKSAMKVYVAPADVDAYKADTYWSKFNILPHTSKVTVTFTSLFGTVPASQTVDIRVGTVSAPADLTHSSYTFKGWFTYNDVTGYVKINDFSNLEIYNDTTIYGLWDGVDISSYFTVSTYSGYGVSGYQITGYTDELKQFPDLVIPATINGVDVVSIKYNAFSSAYWLNSVTFAEDSKLATIDRYAFEDTYNLTKFVLPSSIQYMGSGCFSDSGLTTLTFDGEVHFGTLNDYSDAFQNGSYISEFELIGNSNYKLVDGMIYNNAMTKLYYAPIAINITQYTIPSTVTVIGRYALYNLKYLEHIYMDETKLTNIGSYAFPSVDKFNDDNNLNLESVTYIGEYAFAYASGITSITVGSGITSVGQYAFYNCSSLTNFYLETTNKATIGAGLFYNCTSLQNVTFVCGSMDVYLYMFENCDNLTYLHLGNVSTWYSNAFSAGGGSKLQYLHIESYISGYSGSRDIFAECPDGMYLIVGADCYDEWVVNAKGYDIGRFILIPDEFTVTYVNPFDADYNYSETYEVFEYVTLPEDPEPHEGQYPFRGWYVKDADNKYYEFDPDTEIVSDITLYAIYDVPNELLFVFEYDDTTLTATISQFLSAQYDGTPLSLPSMTTYDGKSYQVTGIGDNVFMDVLQLSSIVIPDGYETIGVSAFENSGLVSITFPRTLTTIGDRAFYNVQNITELTLNEGLITIGNSSFENCSNLWKCNFPDSLVSIGEYAFAHTLIYWDGVTSDGTQTYSLYLHVDGSIRKDVLSPYELYMDMTGATKEEAGTFINSLYYTPEVAITFDNFNDAYQTYLEYVNDFETTNLILTFEDKYGITFGTGLRSIGNGAFKDAKILKTVYFNEGLETIGNYAFEKAINLTYIEFPTQMTSIGSSSFVNTNVSKVTLPYNVELNNHMFYNCKNLTEVIFQSGITAVPYSMFNGCTNLRSVALTDDIKLIDELAFHECINLVDIYNADADANNQYLNVEKIGRHAFFNAGYNVLDGRPIDGEYTIVLRMKNDQPASSALAFMNAVLDADTIEYVINNWNKTGYSHITIATFDNYDDMVATCMEWIATEEYIAMKHSTDGVIHWMDVPNRSLIRNMYLPKLTEMDDYALRLSPFRSVKFGANLQVLSAYAFLDGDLESVSFETSTGENNEVVGLTHIWAHAFQNCYNLTEITLPDSLYRINYAVFENTRISTLNIPQGVEDIKGGAFYGMYELEEITVSSLNSHYVAYDGILFYQKYTTGLESLVCYPIAKTPANGVIDLSQDFTFRSTQTIYDYAFAGNPYIKKVYLPLNITAINDYAFAYCDQLDWLQIYANVANWGEYVYDGSNLYITNALEIGVPPANIYSTTFPIFDYELGEYTELPNREMNVYVPETDFSTYSNSSWAMFKLHSFTSENKIVVITLELNGGSGAGAVAGVIGQKLTLGSNPIKTGYKFEGWHTDAELTTKYNHESLVDGEFTLYAKWSAIVYTINYYVNGATRWAFDGDWQDTSDEIVPFTFTYDQLFNGTDWADLSLIEVLQVGYNFVGWYNVPNFEGKLFTSFNFGDLTYNQALGREPINMYAKWEQIFYQINFETSEMYESNIVAEYSNPVVYNGTIMFTYTFHEGYDQNHTNDELFLSVYDGDDNPYEYQTTTIEGITYYTITNVLTELNIRLNGVKINEYTINFAPNLSQYATELQGMPSSITVTHGQNLASYGSNYQVVAYGGYDGTNDEVTTNLVKYISTILGITMSDARNYIQTNWVNIDAENPLILDEFDNYNDMYTLYDSYLTTLNTATYDILSNAGFVINYKIVGGLIDLSVPTVNGYVFNSWNLTTYDSISGVVTVSNRPFNINVPITEDITLSATWKAVEYQITLYLNGGALGTNNGEYATITYTTEAEFMLPYNTDTYKQIYRLGYGFAGWYDNVDLLGNAPIEKISAGTYGNLEFYASWQVIEYSITYHLNDGYFSDEILNNPDIYKTKYTINDDFELPTPERTGYSFVNWYENSSFTGNSLSYISAGSREGDIIVYAKWDTTSYNIVYHLNGNYISQVAVNGNIVAYSNNAWLSTYVFSELHDTELIDDIDRTGYDFMGWFDAGDNQVHYIPAATSGDVNLYAKWSPITYSIALDYVEDVTLINGGAPLETTFEFTFDDMVATGYVNVSPTDLIMTNKYFAGWYNEGIKVESINNLNYTIKELTASWKDQKFDIYLTTNDTLANDITSIVKLVGEDGDISSLYGGRLRFMLNYINKSYSKSTPTITYKMSDLTTSADDVLWDSVALNTLTAADDNFYTIETITGNIKLYIDGLEINTYTVTFLNTDGSTAIPSVQVTHGNLLPSVSQPTATGMQFACWCLDSGLTQRFNTGTNVTSDLTLYAKYSLKQYTVRIINNINTNETSLTFDIANTVIFTQPWIISGYEMYNFRLCDAADNITTTIIESTQGYTNDITIKAMYGLITYTISYGTESGVTHTNPTTYTVVDSFVLTPALKEGFTFNYWTDESGQQQTMVAKGTTGNLVFIPNFTLTSENYVSVTYYDGYRKLNTLAIYIGNKLTDLYPVPAKDGYTAVGWYADETLTTPYVFNVTPLTTNISLYAKYTLNTYNITYTYKVQDGASIVKTLDSSEVDNINNTTFNIVNSYKLSNPVATGYTFEGWYYNDQLITSTVDFDATDVEIIGIFNYIVYNIIYTIPEGMATGIGLNTSTFTIDTGDIDLVDPDGINEEYEFLYWVNTINTNEQIETIAAGTTKDIYVTAVFQAKERYVVVQLFVDNVFEKSIKVNKGYAISDPSSEFTKLGYSLDGWYLTNAYTGTKFNFASKFENSTNLYAKWTINEYNINYAYNITPSNVPTLTTSYNITTVVVLPTLQDVYGYVFVGWFEGVDVSGGNYNFSNATKITTISGRTGNLLVVARFDLIRFSITYDYDKTNGILPLTTSYTINDGDINLGAIVPTKDGYNFTGWTILEGTEYVPLANNLIDTSLARNLFIKANYQLIPTTATITRYLNGEFYKEEVVDLNTTLEPNVPTEDGYEFDGWYLNDSYTGNKVITITADMEVYGRLVPITYSIAYFSNLPTVLPTTNPLTYNITTSFELAVPSSIHGYQFDGWYLGAVKVGNNYNFSSAVKVDQINRSTGDLELVAKYSLINYTITYQLGYGKNNPQNPTTFTINDGTITLQNPTAPNGKEFSHWEIFVGDISETITSVDGSLARNITIYARYNDVKSNESASEIIVIAAIIGGVVLFFGILTYSIVGSFRKQHNADNKRIEELLNTLNRNNSTNSNSSNTSGYRDDFQI